MHVDKVKRYSLTPPKSWLRIDSDADRTGVFESSQTPEASWNNNAENEVYNEVYEAEAQYNAEATAVNEALRNDQAPLLTEVMPHDSENTEFVSEIEVSNEGTNFVDQNEASYEAPSQNANATPNLRPKRTTRQPRRFDEFVRRTLVFERSY